MRSWAMLGWLLGAGVAAADPPAEQGEKLVESKDFEHWKRRMLCVPFRCVWHVADSLGGCSGDDCRSHQLVLSDGYSRALGASATIEANAVPRFLNPRQVELISATSLIEKNPGGRPRDAGIPPFLLRRQSLTLAEDGSAFTSEEGPDWLSPERYAQLQKLFALSDEEDPQAPKTPISDAVRAKAQKACGVAEPLGVTHYECRKDAGSCLLVLGGKGEQPLCVAELQGKTVRALPIDKLVPHVDEFSLVSTAVCFVFSAGGVHGQPGDEQCISRERPGRMAFVETKGVHLESADGYPVRKAASVAEGLQLAPTVHAFTVAQLRWGAQGNDSWRDEKDLSLAWQAARVGEALHFHVEVTDDAVVPLGKNPAVHSDHLELDLWPSQEAASKRKGPHLKLGVLLGEGGQAQLRAWVRSKGGKDRNVDEAYSAPGTWTRKAGGYAVDFSLPIEPLRKELATATPWGLELMASDTEEGGRQKALLGTQGKLALWEEYPPTIEEYVRAFPRD